MLKLKHLFLPPFLYFVIVVVVFWNTLENDLASTLSQYQGSTESTVSSDSLKHKTTGTWELFKVCTHEREANIQKFQETAQFILLRKKLIFLCGTFRPSSSTVSQEHPRSLRSTHSVSGALTVSLEHSRCLRSTPSSMCPEPSTLHRSSSTMAVGNHSSMTSSSCLLCYLNLFFDIFTHMCNTAPTPVNRPITDTSFSKIHFFLCSFVSHWLLLLNHGQSDNRTDMMLTQCVCTSVTIKFISIYSATPSM